MKMKQAFLGAMSLVASVAASAANLDLGSFTLFYDEGTAFGDPVATVGPGNEVGFTWSLGSAVAYQNVGGNPVVPNLIQLPSYTVTAKPGFSLSGPLNSFSGNVVYSDFNGNNTAMLLLGGVSFDGGAGINIDTEFTKTALISVPELAEVGSFSLEKQTPVGNFQTVSFIGSLLLISSGTEGLSLAAIQSRSEDFFKVSFVATPVPVPPAAWLFSSALVGLVLRRRTTA